MLADGEFHSGQQLAHAFGVSRSAIWKAAHALRELGSVLHAVRNRGYRLGGAGDPLDAALSVQGITRNVRMRVRDLEVYWTVGSTNTVLLERRPPPPGECDIALAEYQSAGRGRRGRLGFAARRGCGVYVAELDLRTDADVMPAH